MTDPAALSDKDLDAIEARWKAYLPAGPMASSDLQAMVREVRRLRTALAAERAAATKKQQVIDAALAAIEDTGYLTMVKDILRYEIIDEDRALPATSPSAGVVVPVPTEARMNRPYITMGFASYEDAERAFKAISDALANQSAGGA